MKISLICCSWIWSFPYYSQSDLVADISPKPIPKPSIHLSLSYTPVILDMRITGHSLLKLFYIKNNPIININTLVYYITGNTS